MNKIEVIIEYLFMMNKPFTIPVYKNKIVKIGLPSEILGDIGISKAEFISLLS